MSSDPKADGGSENSFAPSVVTTEVEIAESLRMPFARDAQKVMEILEATNAVAIKLESRGPVFYRQRRVGKDGRIFHAFKFRSMEDSAEDQGAMWAAEDDPRVTKVGRVIRFLRIDELPQIINVFRAEMSLVGPRPERPEFVKELEARIPFYGIRHSIRPGITGWAQVKYGYGASVEDALKKLEYDLFYLKNMSIILDIKILLKTIGVVLFGQGAR